MNLGSISFQANGKADVFLFTEVIADSDSLSNQFLYQPLDSEGFEGLRPWEEGDSTEFIKVSVSGDTTAINGWFRASLQGISDSYVVRIYLEYEETETIVGEPGIPNLAETDAKSIEAFQQYVVVP